MARNVSIPPMVLLLALGGVFLLSRIDSESDLVVVGLVASPFGILGAMYVVGVLLEERD